jgi:hypothetical protein
MSPQMMGVLISGRRLSPQMMGVLISISGRKMMGVLIFPIFDLKMMGVLNSGRQTMGIPIFGLKMMGVLIRRRGQAQYKPIRLRPGAHCQENKK